MLKEYIYPILSTNPNLPEFADDLWYAKLPKNEVRDKALTIYETSKNNSFTSMNCKDYAFEYRLSFKIMSLDAKQRDDLGDRVITEVLGMQDDTLRQINFVNDDSFFNEFTDWYEWNMNFNIYIDN